MVSSFPDTLPERQKNVIEEGGPSGSPDMLGLLRGCRGSKGRRITVSGIAQKADALRRFSAEH
jgi:hypothetical protein